MIGRDRPPGAGGRVEPPLEHVTFEMINLPYLRSLSAAVSWTVANKPRQGCRLVDLSTDTKANDGAFRMSFGEGISGISENGARLTQRKAGCSDNSEAGETPWFDANMAWKSGQWLSIGQGGTPVTICTEHRSLKVFIRQRQPRPFLVPEDAGNPEAPLGVHNLDRVDASREWMAIILRVSALVGTPHVNEITELLDAVRNASLEEAVGLKVGVISLDVHVGS